MSKKMGISLITLCTPRVGSCMGKALVMAKQGKVLRVVKMDGNILEFKAPVRVKDILDNLSGGLGIGLSKKALEHLPPNYQLKIGKVYYILPSLTSDETPSSEAMESTKAADREQPASGVTRIKVVITKQQLQQLLTKQISVGEVLSALKRASSDCYSIDSPSWKPKLESIPEGSE